ncbi:MAG: hypothetical protein R3A79_27705, partial [Nannocystaceae bacterium]
MEGRGGEAPEIAGRRRIVADGDRRGEARPEAPIGDGEDDRLRDRRVAEEDALDGRGIDVAAAADDHAIGATADHDLSLRTYLAEVLGRDLPARRGDLRPAQREATVRRAGDGDE